MEALYAFMRHTDDLADDAKPRPVVACLDPRRDALAAWRAALEGALQGDSSTPIHPSSLIPVGSCHRTLLVGDAGERTGRDARPCLAGRGAEGLLRRISGVADGERSRAAASAAGRNLPRPCGQVARRPRRQGASGHAGPTNRRRPAACKCDGLGRRHATRVRRPDRGRTLAKREVAVRRRPLGGDAGAWPTSSGSSRRRSRPFTSGSTARSRGCLTPSWSAG